MMPFMELKRELTEIMTGEQIDRVKRISYKIHPIRSKRLCPSYLQRLYERREAAKKRIYEILATLNPLNPETINEKLNEIENA